MPLLRRADGGMQLFTSADTPEDKSMVSVVMDKSAEESIWAPPFLPSMPSRKEPTPSFVLEFGLAVALDDVPLTILMRFDDGRENDSAAGREDITTNAARAVVSACGR